MANAGMSGSFGIVARIKRALPLGPRLPLILQAEAAECGLACLAMISSYYGHGLSLLGLREKFSTSLRGMSLSQLRVLAAELDFLTRPLRLDLPDLPKLRVPCLLHWDLDHFVVLKSATSRRLVVHDPSQGSRRLTYREASDHFTGVALEFEPKKDFKPITETRILTLRGLTGKLFGFKSALARIGVLALALEVLSLVVPFYLQWVLDRVLRYRDAELLTTLGLGFLFITLAQAFVAAARSWTVTSLGATINVQWQRNLVSHLLNLPLRWFEMRHVGDVVSRLGSAQTIQKTISGQFVGSVLDGCMSLASLCILALYSPLLAGSVFAAFLLYTAIRFLFFGPLRRAREEQISKSARQESEIIESVRGALAVKMLNLQDRRELRYANMVVSTANAEVFAQRLTALFALASQLVFGVGRVLLIWLAASKAIEGQLTSGMVVAAIAFADQFMARASALTDKAMDLKMLGLHTERLSDIAMHKPEPRPLLGKGITIVDSSICLRNVSFRYATNGPWVLKDLCLDIKAGEIVAITGPSGCGKTTLAKILLGLLEPIEGEVLIGGAPMADIGVHRFRDKVGAVMQEDQIFAGTVLENISCFETKPNFDKAIGASKLAAIHNDILSLPMGYGSLVGDMGTALSGGQKQRVLLARALYRDPTILVLDEATSHLDIETERKVNQALSQIKATRIVIAHRPETIATADRVICLKVAS